MDRMASEGGGTGWASVEIVEHTADWALRVRGRDLVGLFRLAAEGMAMLMVGDLSVVALEQARDVALDAYDTEGLLVAWLGELAYFAERDRLVCRAFEFRELSPTSLHAVIRGGHVADLQKHIKAVTYHDLAIRQFDDGLEVIIVFDV